MTQQGEVTRIISVRRARRKEAILYEKEKSGLISRFFAKDELCFCVKLEYRRQKTNTGWKLFQPVFISMSGVSKLFEAASPRFINSHGEFIVAQVLDLPLAKVWEKNRRPQVFQTAAYSVIGPPRNWA